MNEFNKLTKKVMKVVNDREWGQFLSFKNLSMSLAMEAAEIMEHFQWKTQKEEAKHVQKHKQELGGELADVQIYLLELAEKAGLDLPMAVERKLKEVTEKYPVSEFRNRHTNKYDRK